jgi:hypothetical protein
MTEKTKDLFINTPLDLIHSIIFWIKPNEFRKRARLGPPPFDELPQP